MQGSGIFELKIEDRLYVNKLETDQKFSHIQLDEEKCRECQSKICLTICPANVYTMAPGQPDRVIASYENCLECGACRVACPGKGLRWSYPNGGMGIRYRFG